jgi:hypothetical protein
MFLSIRKVFGGGFWQKFLLGIFGASKGFWHTYPKMAVRGAFYYLNAPD